MPKATSFSLKYLAGKKQRLKVAETGKGKSPYQYIIGIKKWFISPF